MRKPISPRAHGAIDYGFLAFMTVAPAVLGLQGPARVLPRLFGGGQGMLNALTDQPYAVRRVVPFGAHGQLEKAAGPAFVALPLLTGALRERRARLFFGAALVLLVLNWNLTDWDAAPEE